jgi:hypothetical protein
MDTTRTANPDSAGIRNRETDLRFLTLVLAVAAIMLFLYGRIDYTGELFVRWDLHKYRVIALASPRIDTSVPRPFVYRPLGPFIAGILPLGIDTSFYLLNTIASLGLIALLYRFMRRLGSNPGTAAATVLLYIFNKHFFGFTSWNYFHINDVLTNIFIIAMFWSLLEGRWVRFGAAMLLASVTRETFLLVIPTAVIYLLEGGRFRKEWRGLLAAILPALAIFVSFRLLVRPDEGMTLAEAFLTFGDRITRFYGLYYLLVNPFVPLTLVPLAFIGTSAAYFRGRRYMLVYYGLVLFAALFGSNNERLLNPAFIVFYPLVAVVIEDRILPDRILFWVIMTGGFLSSLHYMVARYPLPSREWTILLSGGSAVLITLLSIKRALDRRAAAG